MKIKVRSIQGAALSVSAVMAAVVLGLVWIAGLSQYWIFFVPMVILIVGYLTALLVFNRFVAYRIKPIYQIFLSRSIKTRELSRKHDLVEGIEENIHQWVETSSREIERLKENERYRKEFLGNVSHEIKTPIFTIQGYILTLLDGGMEDETINRKYLERSERSIDRLISIVEDLEEISKLESGMLLLERERFDITALVGEIAESVEMEARKKDITLRPDNRTNPTPIYVDADRKRIGQVLTNLVVNAIKYGKPGGNIKISYIDGFDKIMLEIKDDGIGIAEENIPRLFERFYRVDKSRSREQGGTGLGLAIVKHILEAHRETITVRSVLNEGTTFSFSLSKAKD